MATVHCAQHSFTNIEAVIFDKDGTLARVESYLHRLGQCRVSLIEQRVSGLEAALLKSLGVNQNGINPTGALAVASRYENMIAAAAYIAATGTAWITALEIAQVAFTEADQHFHPKALHTPLMTGALTLLLALKATGIKLGLLSADMQTYVEEFAATYALNDYFDWLQGTQPQSPDKTHVTFFNAACAGLQVQPEAILVIGDSAADLKMATVGGAAGFIGFVGGWQTRPQITGATILIEHLGQIKATT